MPQGLARPYFLVKRQGETRIIGARRLALAGAYNFRDLGGIRTLESTPMAISGPGKSQGRACAPLIVENAS